MEAIAARAIEVQAVIELNEIPGAIQRIAGTQVTQILGSHKRTVRPPVCSDRPRIRVRAQSMKQVVHHNHAILRLFRSSIDRRMVHETMHE